MQGAWSREQGAGSREHGEERGGEGGWSEGARG